MKKLINLTMLAFFTVSNIAVAGGIYREVPKNITAIVEICSSAFTGFGVQDPRFHEMCIENASLKVSEEDASSFLLVTFINGYQWSCKGTIITNREDSILYDTEMCGDF